MIYADINGSSPLKKSVCEYLKNRAEGPFANPNAIHSLGQKVHRAMEECRKIIAEIVGAHPRQIFFNSGASESISHIFFSTLGQTEKKTILTSGIEHSAVQQACSYYKAKGYNIIHTPITNDGLLDLHAFEILLNQHKEDLALVCLMAANNETGVVQPYHAIGKLCQEAQIPYLCDTTQYIGKTEFNFEASNIDFAMCSGHKIGALTGSGFLLVKDPEKLTPFIFGGGQEGGQRGGTQNYLGVETIAVALKDFQEQIPELIHLKECREIFEKEICDEFPNLKIMGQTAPRLPGTTLIAYPGIHGQAVQIELESQNIFVTTSSACSDNEPQTSKVLKAMGQGDDVGRSVVRISLSSCTRNCYKEIKEALSASYKKLAKIKSY